MYAILNKNGAITGYVVGDYYLPLDMACMFFDNLDCSHSLYASVQGMVMHSDVTDMSQRVNSVTARTFEGFREVCLREGVGLRDTLFVPCHYLDFDLYKTNSIWTVKGIKCHKCYHRGRVIGYLATDKSVVSWSSVKIIMLEVIRQREGLGSIIVNELKRNGIKMTGISVASAKEFWLSHGAVFYDCNRFKL